MKIIEFPVELEAAAAQAALFAKLATAYTENGELRVQISGGAPGDKT